MDFIGDDLDAYEYESNTNFCRIEMILAIEQRQDPDAAYEWTRRLMVWLRPYRNSLRT